MKKQLTLWIGCTCLALQGLQSQTVKEIGALRQEDLQEIGNGEAPDTVVYIPRGWEVPLKLVYSGDFFNITSPSNQPPYRVTVERDLFMRVPNKETFMLSLDGENWKPFMELVTGSFGVHFELGDGPVLSLAGALEERKEVQ